MNEFQTFTWKGEPIQDIHKWAHARRERMVHYEMTRRSPYGDEITQGEMPQSFWDSLLWSSNTFYKEIDGSKT